MDDIEIVDDAPPPGPPPAPTDALALLLESCKGHPRQYETLRELLDGPTKLWALRRGAAGTVLPKLPSDTKALGGVYWVSKSALQKSATKWHPFADCLTLEPLAMPGQWAPKIRCWYSHPTREDILGVPRFWGLSMFGAPDKDIRTQGHALSYRPPIDLRDLQKLAVAQSLEALAEWGGATVVADCGFGKTRLAVGLASALGRKTLILCNREVLMLQWADVIKSLTTWQVSWLQGSDSLEKDTVKVGTGPEAPRFLGAKTPADICIGSIDTLIEGAVPKAIIETFGTVIVDEAHHLAAATLVHALPLLPARNVVCLSATPDRRDGLEHALYWLGGPATFVYKRLPSITGIHGAVVVRKVVPQGCANREKMYANGQLAFAEMTTALSEDVLRNKYILDAIVDALAAGRRKIIVVSALVAHCGALQEAMKARDASLTSALMAGPTVQSVLAKAPDTRLVFATYAMLEEGYDDPVLDTLVLATPRSRVQQTVGRVERTHEGKLTPLVIDIADGFSIYPNMWFKRAHFYKSRGFAIEHV